jgi:tetratricopeptide (TPR) repeat protein
MLWDVATGQPRGDPLTGHTARIGSLAFSPDGQTLASGGCGKTDKEKSWDCLQGEIKLWDIATGQPLGGSLTGHTDHVLSVAFSPDGQTLASGSLDSTVMLWDVATGQPLGDPLTGHTDRVLSVAFSPDGQTLLSGNGDGTFRQWDVATRQPRGELSGGELDHAMSSVAFSPDRTMVAFGYCSIYHEVYCAEGAVSLWDVETGHPIGDPPRVIIIRDMHELRQVVEETGHPIGDPLRGHTSPVESIAFSPDGTTLVSVACGKGGEMGCNEGEIMLWDVETMLPIGDPLRGHTSYINSVAFSPDGQTVATGSSDQTIRLWRVSVEPWATRACRVAGRNLSWDEWQHYLGDRPYQKTCPSLPIHPSVLAMVETMVQEQGMDRAITHYQTMIADSSPEIEAHARQVYAQQLVQEANDQSQSGDLVAATTTFSQALELDPTLELTPTTRARQLYAHALVQKGERLAGGGDLITATATMSQALELDPTLELTPTTHARQIYVGTLVSRGERSAYQGDLITATATMSQALEFDPTLELTPTTRARQLNADTLVREGEKLAGAGLFSSATIPRQNPGDLITATATLSQALELDPTLDLTPTTHARQIHAQFLVEASSVLALEGDIIRATAFLSRAQELDPAVKMTANDWNALCWYGSLWGYAAEVMDACQQAVSLEPTHGGIRDSRGLARALTGDTEGAMDDFAAFVLWASSNEQAEAIEQRKQWYQALARGDDPFTEDVLQALREE